MMTRTWNLFSFLLIFVILWCCFLPGCGGGGSSNGTSTSGNSTVSGNAGQTSGGGSNGTPTSPTTPSPFAAWSGIIAYRDAKGVSSGGGSNLWFLTPSGSKLVTNQAGRVGSIRWSPDGSYLAYFSSDLAGASVPSVNMMIAGRDGSSIPPANPGTATIRIEDNIALNWLNDSSLVLVGDYFTGIRGFKPDLSAVSILNSNNATFDHNPVPSLDGQWIYFTHHESGANGTLYRIKTATALDGKTHSYADCEKLVAISTSQDENVQMEPTADGKLIVAFSGAINVLNPEAKTLTPEVQFDATYLRLAPDGKSLAALNFGDQAITIFDIATFKPRYTINSTSDQSNNYFIQSMAWAPDGSALAMAEFSYSAAGKVCLWRPSDTRLQTIFQDTSSKNIGHRRSAEGEAFQSLSWTK